MNPFISGMATGALTMLALLLFVRWIVFEEHERSIRQAYAKPTVPDKIEPRPVANTHPAIPTHPRLHVVPLSGDLDGGRLIAFPMKNQHEH